MTVKLTHSNRQVARGIAGNLYRKSAHPFSFPRFCCVRHCLSAVICKWWSPFLWLYLWKRYWIPHGMQIISVNLSKFLDWWWLGSLSALVFYLERFWLSVSFLSTGAVWNWITYLYFLMKLNLNRTNLYTSDNNFVYHCKLVITPPGWQQAFIWTIAYHQPMIKEPCPVWFWL